MFKGLNDLYFELAIPYDKPESGEVDDFFKIKTGHIFNTSESEGSIRSTTMCVLVLKLILYVFVLFYT